MADWNLNVEDPNYTSDELLIPCICEQTCTRGPCEICGKSCSESSGPPGISWLSRNCHPVVLANLLMVLAIFLYSANSVFIKAFIEVGARGSSFIFLRSIITIPFLIFLTYGIKLNQKRPIIVLTEDKNTNYTMIAGCVSGAIRQSLLPFIMETAEASTIGILSPSIPIFTAIFSHLFKIEKIVPITIFCLFLSFIGVFLGLDLYNKFDESKTSYILLLLIPITKSFQVVFLKMSSDKFDSLSLLRNQVAISILVCLPGSILDAIWQLKSIKLAIKSLLHYNFKQILCSLYSVVAILLTAWRIQIYCLKVIGANAVSIFQTLRPFFTMILGFIILGEPITLKKTLGSVIVCIALVVYQKSRVRPPEQH